MIELKVSEAQREQMVLNVIATWDQATPEELAAGRQWYVTAHLLAEQLGGGDVHKGAGLLAALSPQTSWSLNVTLAERAVESGPSGHVGDALRKAAMILDGADPVSVLPMHSKTGHFYRCIVDPSDLEPVCIDRHAHDIAVGEVYGKRDRGLSSKKRYETVADAYRQAAAVLEETPSVVQAVTWVVWRAAISGTSTRGELR